MTKPSQGCMNALQCMLCAKRTSVSHMRGWIMVFYEWWAICEWQRSERSHLFLSERSFSSVYFREGCVMQALSNNPSKRTIVSWIMHCLKYAFICTEQVLTLHTDEFSLTQPQRTKLPGWGNPHNAFHRQLSMQTECRPLRLGSTSACRSHQGSCESRERLFSGKNYKNRKGGSCVWL